MDLSGVRTAAKEKRTSMDAQHVDSAVKKAALKIWNYCLKNTFAPLNPEDDLKPQTIQRAVPNYETG